MLKRWMMVLGAVTALVVAFSIVADVTLAKGGQGGGGGLQRFHQLVEPARWLGRLGEFEFEEMELAPLLHDQVHFGTVRGTNERRPMTWHPGDEVLDAERLPGRPIGGVSK